MQPRANPLRSTVLMANAHLDLFRYDLLQAMLERGEVDPFIVIHPRTELSIIDRLLVKPMDLLRIVQFYLRLRATPLCGLGSELMQGWTRVYRPAGET